MGESSTAVQYLLEVNQLRKQYGTGAAAHLAVDGVTFDVRPGEFLCIVGPSGAGKTTLLRCISGLVDATSGEVRFEGRPLAGVPGDLGIVFQDYSRSLYPWMTNEANVALPLKVRGMPRAEREAVVAQVLESVGLAKVARKYPWELSGGMQQRVAIARALSYKPRMLLMDEPFASVDAQTRFTLEDLVLRVRSELGISIVLVTHDIDEAVYLADRVVVLSGAPSRVREIVQVNLGDKRSQIKTRSEDTFIRLRSHILGLVMAA
ncbi:ABC transporter ATP-binding protein [soil metagenome]